MKHLLSHFLLFLCFVACENEPKSIFDFETTDEIVEFLLKDFCKEPQLYKENFNRFTQKNLFSLLHPKCHYCSPNFYTKKNFSSS